jgi:hypothetical protein
VVDALATTLLSVFPTIHAMDIPDSFNTILFATRQPTTAENFIVNFEQLKTLSTVHPLLLESMQLTVANLQPQPETTLVFTDDRAQIEWLTNSLVMNFLFFGDMETIQ